MKAILSTLATAGLLLAAAQGQPPAKPVKLEWQPLNIVRSVFGRDMGMLDSEREEYATHLAALAVGMIRDSGGKKEAMAQPRRILALALHLSPRNKSALVANFQLGKGLMPEAVSSQLQPQSLSLLLLKRGQLLTQQAGLEDLKLSGYFFELAAELNPRNDDAVYMSELHRLKSGPPDWTLLTHPAPAVAPTP